MGLTRQYLRFVPGSIFGIICSGSSLFINFNGKKNFVAVPAAENVLIWNIRTEEIVKTLRGGNHNITCMIGDLTRGYLAVGYADGSIRLFNVDTGNCTAIFSGHKSPVSCLAYDSNNMRLASGGKDTEIVIWDVVAEQGLFRMRGHKGPITKCQFLKEYNVLISSSEDTFLKFWDLDTQHCFKTLVGNRGEVWDFVLLNNNRLITGINDTDLRVWQLEFKGEIKSDTDYDNMIINEVGKIMTEGQKRTISLKVDDSERIMGCHGYTKTLQLFKFLSQDEAQKKFHKRRRKEKKKLGITEDNEANIKLCDEIEKLKPIKADAKIVNFAIKIENTSISKIILLLNNNSFSLFQLDLNKDADPLLLKSISSCGHRSDVNTLSFSSNNAMILSASGESARIWNRDSQYCTHIFKTEHALCSLFVPGNNYCIIGTKVGRLQIFDLSSSQLVENIDAHEGSVTCICTSYDQRGIASGGNDKEIKFWDFELINDEAYSNTKKRLSLNQTRILNTSEEIVCLKFSPNQKYIATALLDFTVKVFFCDTLKFAFCLYGHKLPVVSIDISYDSTLLVTGSKDRNIKIWSMEFGNCLKSIFAHEDSITCLQFLPKTHMIFSGGNDKYLKQWDCDNFQKIMTLEGHQAKVIALAVSPDGTCVISSSHDKSLRLWEKTNEPLILEEEKELERESEIDKELISQEPLVIGELNKEVGLATKATIETIKNVEQLIEAIDVYKEEVLKLEEYKNNCEHSKRALAPPTPHPLLMVYSTTCPIRYMLQVVRKIRSSSLEETLLHLPFNHVLDFLKILTELVLQGEWDTDLVSRCIFFLLRMHLRQLMTCKEVFVLIEKLKTVLHSQLRDIKDTSGFIMAGLKFMQREIEQSEEVCLFSEAVSKLKKRKRKRNVLMFT